MDFINLKILFIEDIYCIPEGEYWVFIEVFMMNKLITA